MNDRDVTIFIVDDDPSVRKSLLLLVRSAGWPGEAFASPREFLARPPFSGTGCVILDVRMPEMTGLELREWMAEHNISLPVIFLTGHGDLPMGVEAMKKGAVDFLEKPVDDEVLLRAIHRAVELHAAVRVQARERERIRARIERLTPREREVLGNVISGALNKQIAAKLGITEATVKVHRGRVMQKLGASSVVDLVHLCEMAGLKPETAGLSSTTKVQ